jgi:WD40 repeat protein
VVDIFVSYARHDAQDAAEIAGKLHNEGHSVFVDADPDNGIPAGAEWRRTLFHELRICDAVIFLNSPAAQGSAWCHCELAVAAELGKQVYSLDLTRGIGPHPILSGRQGIPFAGSLDAGIQQLADRIGSEEWSRATRPRWDRTRPSYPGLAAMDVADAGIFFGREKELQKLIARVDGIGLRDGDLVAVLGPSGAGKSSLIRAGLAARLAARRAGWIVADPFEPGERPLDTLADCLVKLAPDELNKARCLDMLRDRDNGLGAVAALAARRAEFPATRLLVVVDQAEQLVTVASKQHTLEFLAALDTGLGNGSPVTVVLTIRSDRFDEIQQLPVIGPLLGDPLAIGPMLRSQLGEVIEGPAERADLSFERGLVADMINDATRGNAEDAVDALPLLAFTLRAMLDQLPEGTSRFTKDGYEKAGKIEGAIALHATAADAALSRGGADHPEQLLLRFVVLSEDRPPGARPVLRSELTAGERASAVELENRRFLTGDEDTVRLAHELLLTAWPRLASAIASRRDDLLRQARLERQAEDWKDDNGQLLGREAAATAAAWLRTGNGHDAVRSYVRASMKAARRRRAQFISAFAVVTALALIASVTSGVAFHQAAVARQQTGVANYNALVDKAVSSDPTLSALLLLAAYRNEPPSYSGARYQLIGTENTPLSILLPTPNEAYGADSVAFSPRGTLLAAGTGNGIALWNVATPGNPRYLGLSDPGTQVTSVAFSPDGTLLAAGTSSGLSLWKTGASGHLGLLGQLPGSTGIAASSVAFSPDGSLLAAGTANGLAAGTANGISLWDVTASGDPRYLGQSDLGTQVNSVAFSPDGTRLASGTNSELQLWQVGSFGRLSLLSQSAASTQAVAFNPDGTRLAAGAGSDLQLWQVGGSGTLSLLSTSVTTNGAAVESVAFSPDGMTVADSTDQDSTIWLWNITVPSQPVLLTAPLTGSKGTPYSVAFSPDGQMMASADAGGTIRLWAIPQTTVLPGQPLSSVAFSPDGQILADGSTSGTFHLWNMTDPARPRLFAKTEAPAGSATIFSVAFSPDGHVLATGDANGIVQLWDVADPARPIPLGHFLAGIPQPIRSLAFSPDSPILAIGGQISSTVELWNVANPARPMLAGQIPATPRLARFGVLSTLAFSPHGHILAAGPGLGLWDVADPAHPRLLSRINAAPPAVSFSPNGRTLAASDPEDSVQLWNVTDPARPSQLSWRLYPQGNPGVVISLSFSPDGKTLAAGAQNGTTQLFDISGKTGEYAFPDAGPPLTTNSSAVTGMAFSPHVGVDGDQVLATVSLYGVLQLWDLNVNYAISRICPTAASNLTPQIWNAEIPTLDYQPICKQ